MNTIKEKIKTLFVKAEQKKASDNLIEDSQGRLCATSMFSEIDLARDLMVKTEVEIAMNRKDELQKYQSDLLKTIADFFEKSAREYGLEKINPENGMTLTSINGLNKIIIVKTKTTLTNEKILIAKSLLDEMIEKRGTGLDEFFKSLILDAFESSATGQIRVDKIIDLRNKACNYPEWSAIKKALDNATTSIFKKRYLNFYHRESIKNDWEKIQLNLSKN